MASINVRKDTGKLYIDFTYRSQRCREQTGLNDTPTNRKKVHALVQRLEADILLGTFDYERYFPNSPKLQTLQPIQAAIDEASNPYPRFKDFSLTWFEELKPSWRKSYTESVTNVLSRLHSEFGDIAVDAIKKADVLKFRADLSAIRKKNGEGFSPSHINRHIKILLAILNEAADRYDFVQPCKKLKPLHVPKTDISPFRPEEILLILDNVREDFKDYFVVRFFTGMRTGEIDGLQWECVDFERRLIYIRKTYVSGEEQYTKNDFSQRDIQMSEPVFQALMNMKPRTGDKKFVFVNQNGNPLDQNAVTKRVWYPLLRNLEIKKRNPYQIRHTAATLWLASGESPEWIANQMGHANTEMLFRVYSRFVPNLTRQDGKEADSLFLRILNTPNQKKKPD